MIQAGNIDMRQYARLWLCSAKAVCENHNENRQHCFTVSTFRKVKS